jgi:hypothetical protein
MGKAVNLLGWGGQAIEDRFKQRGRDEPKNTHHNLLDAVFTASFPGSRVQVSGPKNTLNRET